MHMHATYSHDALMMHNNDVKIYSVLVVRKKKKQVETQQTRRIDIIRIECIIII